MPSGLELQRLELDRVPDFFRLHSDPSLDGGWCYCVAWWVPTWEGWGQRSAVENRALREDLFAAGQLDGYLCYDAGAPIAWCQCGPRDRLPKLCVGYGLEPAPDVWAFTCFLVLPAWRRRGVARHLLDFALRDLSAQGVRRFQGFPRRGAGLEDGEAWTGPESLFRAAGFRPESEGPRGPIYELTLEAATG